MNSKLAALLLVVFAAVACATPRKPVPANSREKLEKSRESGEALAQQLEPRLTFARMDPKVHAFLEKTARNLVRAWEASQPAPAVRVFEIHDFGEKWQDYALPGIRIYLSADELTNFDYENELASVIAFQLGHVVRDQAAKRFGADLPETGKKIDFFGENGLFSYDDDENLAAGDAAFEMLYGAGYDPRGLLFLWDLYRKNPAKSPFSSDLVENLTENTRRDIALKAPLRNPIVRSKEFLTIRQRIHKK